jgi:hypothetical protein
MKVFKNKVLLRLCVLVGALSIFTIVTATLFVKQKQVRSEPYFKKEKIVVTDSFSLSDKSVSDAESPNTLDLSSAGVKDVMDKASSDLKKTKNSKKSSADIVVLSGIENLAYSIQNNTFAEVDPGLQLAKDDYSFEKTVNSLDAQKFSSLSSTNSLWTNGMSNQGYNSDGVPKSSNFSDPLASIFANIANDRSGLSAASLGSMRNLFAQKLNTSSTESSFLRGDISGFSNGESFVLAGLTSKDMKLSMLKTANDPVNVPLPGTLALLFFGSLIVLIKRHK